MITSAEVQAKEAWANSSTSGGEQHSSSLDCQVLNAEFQEIAAAILNYYRDELEPETLIGIEKIVAGKTKFGHWTANDGEYDREHCLAMDPG